MLLEVLTMKRNEGLLLYVCRLSTHFNEGVKMYLAELFENVPVVLLLLMFKGKTYITETLTTESMYTVPLRI